MLPLIGMPFGSRFRLLWKLPCAALLATACTGEIEPSSTLPGDVSSQATSASAGGSSGTMSAGSSTNGDTAVSAAGVEGTSPTATTTSTGEVANCATADVRIIFQVSCAQSTCHDASQPAGLLDLSGADPAGQMLGVASQLCPGEIRIVAGDPQSSLLWKKLYEAMPACGDKMPVGSTLGASELGCIEHWIVALGSGVPDCETCGGSACVDLTNDADHCGSCDNNCEPGQICSAGACTGCAEGKTACGATCVDLVSDAEHCGGCGVSCGSGEACVSGMCRCMSDGTVSFAADIAPLLDGACAGNACHGGRMPKEGLELSAATSYEAMVGVVADQCSDGRLLVEPGAPAGSYLLNKLTGTALCSGSLMPKADAALDAATVAMIAAWICDGAPDN